MVHILSSLALQVFFEKDHSCDSHIPIFFLFISPNIFMYLYMLLLLQFRAHCFPVIFFPKVEPMGTKLSVCLIFIIVIFVLGMGEEYPHMVFPRGLYESPLSTSLYDIVIKKLR